MKVKLLFRNLSNSWNRKESVMKDNIYISCGVQGRMTAELAMA